MTTKPKGDAAIVMRMCHCCTDREVANFLRITPEKVYKIRHKYGVSKYVSWSATTVRDAIVMHRHGGIPWSIIAERKGARTWKSIYRAAQRNQQLAA